MKFTGLFSRATLLFCLLCTPCFGHGQDVHYNYVRGTNFSGYKTYQWVEVPGRPGADQPPSLPPTVAPPPGLPPLPRGGASEELQNLASSDQLVGEDIKRAVDDQLAQKGLEKVDNSADLQLAYHLVIREEKSVDLTGSGFGGRGYGWWDGSVQGQTGTIPVGTVVIDVYDSSRHQPVWRGDASKTVDLKKDPDKNYKNLQKAMAKLLKNYPPPAAK